MTDYLYVLLLALMPAGGNFAGGVVAELLPTSRNMLNVALHGAAGIVIAVVAVELMPRALGGASPWMVILAFVLGGVASVALKTAIEGRLSQEKGSPGAGMWMVYLAVAVDLFSDGLMIGAGSAVSFGLALLLAIGQITADIPEGFAAIANFKDKGVRKSRRLVLSASYAAPALAGASIGYWILRDQGQALQLSALAFTAGLLIVAAVEDMIPEAHETIEDSRLSTLTFIGGFALFALLSSYFEVS